MKKLKFAYYSKLWYNTSIKDRTGAYQYRGDIMIKIEVRSRDSLPHYVSVKGHAGNDAVCAGVSAIIQTAGECVVRGLNMSWHQGDWKLTNASGIFVIELFNTERLHNEKTMARDWLLNLVAMLFIYANKNPDNVVWDEVDFI